MPTDCTEKSQAQARRVRDAEIPVFLADVQSRSDGRLYPAIHHDSWEPF